MKLSVKIYVLAFMVACGIQYTFASEHFSEEGLYHQQVMAMMVFLDQSINQQSINQIGDASALDSYEKINAKWNSMKDLTDLKTDSESWKRKEVQIDKGWYKSRKQRLLWEPEIQPSFGKAVISIIDSNTCAECLMASHMVRIKIISDILGDELMEQLVNTFQFNKIDLRSFDFIQILSSAFQTPCEENFQGVCFMSFANIEYYPLYKPNGYFQNHNVIKLSDGTFIGFDPEFFTHPRTYDDLERYMYDEFISSKDVKEGMEEKHKSFCKGLEARGGFDDFKRLRKSEQEKCPPYRFDVSKFKHFMLTGELVR